MQQNFKNAAGVVASDFAKKADLANLKSDVDKLAEIRFQFDKLKNIPTNLGNLKNKL